MGETLHKCKFILETLERLRSRLGADAFVLEDKWDADLCAVGIASPRNPAVLVYFSCFKQPDGHFYVEGELPPGSDDDAPYQVAHRAESVSFEELVRIAQEHLSRAV